MKRYLLRGASPHHSIVVAAIELELQSPFARAKSNNLSQQVVFGYDMIAAERSDRPVRLCRKELAKVMHLREFKISSI